MSGHDLSNGWCRCVDGIGGCGHEWHPQGPHPEFLATGQGPMFVCPACDRWEFIEYRMSLDTVCDFCSSPDPKWCYPCRDFTIRSAGNLHGHSLPPQVFSGAWAACEACAELIEAGDRKGVTRRSWDELGVMTHDLPPLAVSMMKSEWSRIHSLFFQWKYGPRIPSAEYDHPTRRHEPPKGVD